MKHSRLAGVVTCLFVAALLVGSAAAADGGPVNVNTASVTELAQVKGIGEVKARAIVEYREQNGPFKSVDDLVQVKGIGDRLLAKLRPQLTLGVAVPAAVAAPASTRH